MTDTYGIAAYRAAADRLLQARSEGMPCPPVRTGLPASDMAAAYAVQSLITEADLAAGRRLVGRKIGLTSKSVQKQLRIDQPDFGMLFADMVIDEGATVPRGRFLQPRVEAEVAFVLARPLDDRDLTLTDVLDSISYALPAIEIVDSRIADWDISLVDTIADNASSGGFVLGASPRRLADLDLRLCGMVLDKNGEGTSFGAGAACLGHPLHAALWLARKMVECGRPLQAGEILLAGALGPVVLAAPGDWFEARISGLGSVRVSFAGMA